MRCALRIGVPGAPQGDANEPQIGEACWRCCYMLLPKDGSNSEALKKIVCACVCACVQACMYVCVHVPKETRRGHQTPWSKNNRHCYSNIVAGNQTWILC